MTRTSQRILALFAVATLPAFAALSGCGDDRLPLYPVQGRVLDGQGQPAIGAQVYFHSASGGSEGIPTPVGKVDDQGDFHLTTYVEGDGAPEGEYAVTIIWPPPRTTPFEPVGGDQLNGTYADPKNPRLRFTVKADSENTVPAINLP